MGRSATRATLAFACIGMLLTLAGAFLASAHAAMPFQASIATTFAGASSRDPALVQLSSTAPVADRTDVDRASLAAANGARMDASEQRRIIIGSAASLVIFLLVCGFAFWRAAREPQRPEAGMNGWDGHAN